MTRCTRTLGLRKIVHYQRIHVHVSILYIVYILVNSITNRPCVNVASEEKIAAATSIQQELGVISYDADNNGCPSKTAVSRE